MAVDYSWLFSYYNPCGGDCGTATGNICTGRVYVNVFNRDNEAIDMNASPKIFDEFDASESRFRFFLTTHAERTRYHFNSIHCSQLDIENNPYGEHYTAEYWCECISGSPDRDRDKLVKIERVTWANDRVAESRLDISQEQNIALLTGLQVFTQEKAGTDAVPDSWGEYLSDSNNFCCDTLVDMFSGFTGANVGACLQSICNKVGNWPDVMAGTQWICHTAIGYDTVQQMVHITAWLEKDGELQTTPLSMQYVLIDSDGDEIINISGDENDLQELGVFFKQVGGVELTPDEVYFAVITINDEDDEPHVSAASPVAWD